MRIWMGHSHRSHFERLLIASDSMIEVLIQLYQSVIHQTSEMSVAKLVVFKLIGRPARYLYDLSSLDMYNESFYGDALQIYSSSSVFAS